MKDEQYEAIVSNLLFINPVLYKGIIKLSKDKHNLTMGSMFILGTLKKCSGLTMSEISNVISIPKPNVTAIIDKLIACQYVERYADDNDRRIVNIRISQKGLEFFQEVKIDIAEGLKKLLDVLSENELEDLFASTNTVRTLLHKVFIDNHKINI